MKLTWRYYMALVPLVVSATPIWPANVAYVGAIQEKAFCKINTAVIEELNKDPIGTSYCAGILDMQMSTV